MEKIVISTLIAMSVLLFSCNNESAKRTMESNYADTHSYAQPSTAVVKHLDWQANVRFDERMIDAVATWTVSVTKDAEEVIFDTERLIIKNVLVDGKDSEWRISSYDPIKGTALIIQVPKNHQGDLKVSIEYRTPTSARALFWAAPSQTYGKKQPFLFTQSQAILARTWIPCQDSPGIRFTYEASVKVPSGMMALMSAENPQAKSMNGVYKFKMDQAIPSYLLALAVGDIEFQSIGPRSGVYAEPGQLVAASYEFSDLEKMISVAEGLYGSYAWGRYDILVLPPSFPFGGMENPRLTFATPTIIAGDKSLVSLVAHELAHSWSGNLVTNETWDDFWLNEGFTVYFEMRIMEEFAGKDYANMLANLGYSSLKNTIEDLGPTSADTKLKLDLEGRNPDDGMTDIAYEKGYAFLRFIEQKWGRNNFDEFLKSYFQQFQLKVMNTEGFLKVLKDKMGESLYNDLNVNAWVYEPGLPSNYEPVNSVRFEKVDSVANAFGTAKVKAGELAIVDWSTHEWLRFIESLPSKESSALLVELDSVFKLSISGNAEILCAWFEKSIKNDYRGVDENLRRFLNRVGRRKFLVPLYKALVEENRKDFAKEIYKEARPGYHSVSIQTIDEILNFSAL